MRAPTKCQKCDAQLTPGARGPLPTFCTGCRPSNKPKAGWSLYSCEICGDEFLRNHKSRVTCSVRCATIIKKRRCQSCKAPFRSSTVYRKFCDECYKSARSDAIQKACATGVDISCKWCGESSAGRIGKVFCSAKCKDSYHVHNRRARLAEQGLSGSYVNRSDVGEKDGWICGICGEPVDASIQWPDQQSPSIDHIIPLSKGGPHSMENLQISHLVCNVRKNNGTE